MAEGIIKKKTDRGFGFIRTNRGNDLFFHMSAVDGITFEELQEGQKVSYVEGKSEKGARAESVRPI